MVLVDGQGVPLGVHLSAATPAEHSLAIATLEERVTDASRPHRAEARTVESSRWGQAGPRVARGPPVQVGRRLGDRGRSAAQLVRVSRAARDGAAPRAGPVRRRPAPRPRRVHRGDGAEAAQRESAGRQVRCRPGASVTSTSAAPMVGWTARSRCGPAGSGRSWGVSPTERPSTWRAAQGWTETVSLPSPLDAAAASTAGSRSAGGRLRPRRRVDRGRCRRCRRRRRAAGCEPGPGPRALPPEDNRRRPRGGAPTPSPRPPGPRRRAGPPRGRATVRVTVAPAWSARAVLRPSAGRPRRRRPHPWARRRRPHARSAVGRRGGRLRLRPEPAHERPEVGLLGPCGRGRAGWPRGPPRRRRRWVAAAPDRRRAPSRGARRAPAGPPRSRPRAGRPAPPASTAASVAASESRAKSRRPAQSSQRTTARAKTSVRASTAAPRACSGRHVGELALQVARLGEAGLAHGPGDAEVGELDLALHRQEHVVRGDVAVDHPEPPAPVLDPVGVVERPRHLDGRSGAPAAARGAPRRRGTAPPPWRGRGRGRAPWRWRGAPPPRRARRPGPRWRG